MRIAFVSTLRSAPWGGSEELWLQCAEEAIQQGHEIAVFVYQWPELPAKLQTLQARGAKIFTRPRQQSISTRLKYKLHNRFSGNKDSSINPYHDLKKFNADCVVVTDGATYYAADDEWLRTVLLSNYKAKYIVISQGNGAYHFPADRSIAIDFFKQAKEIVFVAENNRQQAFHQLAYVIGNSRVIQNPVKLSSFEKIPFPHPDGQVIRLAMIGRLCVSDKGQDIVISMMADSFWREANVVVHIYGAGADKQYLEDLVKFYNVADKVIIEGHTAITDIWKKCHGLIMPSIIEGTPLTLLEAMVIGRVCIVTNVGGNAEWIEDGVNGFMAAAPTKELFSEKLKQAMATPAWESIADKAHSTAMAKLDRNPGASLLKRIIA